MYKKNKFSNFDQFSTIRKSRPTLTDLNYFEHKLLNISGCQPTYNSLAALDAELLDDHI